VSRGQAPASVARRLAAVLSWYRVLAGEDLIGVVPTVDLDRPTVNVDDSAVLGLDLHAAAALLRAGRFVAAAGPAPGAEKPTDMTVASGRCRWSGH